MRIMGLSAGLGVSNVSAPEKTNLSAASLNYRTRVNDIPITDQRQATKDLILGTSLAGLGVLAFCFLFSFAKRSPIR